MVGPSASAPPEAQRSRAFETLVQEPDDLVGLIAYALYKQAITETCRAGRPALPSADRRPVPTERDAYRRAAERLLQTFAASAIEEASPDIIGRGVGIAVDSAKDEVVRTIQRRTSFWSAIGVNLAAWALTLLLTALILVTVFSPSWQAALAERIRMFGH